MRKIRCYNCGAVFEDDEAVVEEWDETRGEYWGMPCYEHMSEIRCPSCGSDVIDEYEEEDEDT